jgi:hypothetical protein
MVEMSNLENVADFIIRRVLAEVRDGEALADALNRANPFGNDPHGRRLWLAALLRNAHDVDRAKASSKPAQKTEKSGSAPEKVTEIRKPDPRVRRK